MPRIISTIIFIALINSLFSQAAWAFRVVIDPGHGGVDRGASYGPVQESKLVLHIAEALKTELEQDPRFEVEMTRSNDRLISLSDRVKKAEAFSADLLVSLHANANADRKVRGMEVYFQNQLPQEEENLFLANEENQWAPKDLADVPTNDMSKASDVKTILEDLKKQGRVKLSYYFSEVLQKNWDGHIRQAPFYVVSKSKVPSVLIEIGFISHSIEAQKLAQKEYQKEISHKIFESLVKYSEKIKTQKTKLSKID